MKEVINKTDGTLSWFLQRVTAVGLIFLLGVHLWLLHYKNPGETIRFGNVAIRLRTLTFFFVDMGLLTFGLYHALNGINNIIQDYGIGTTGRRSIGFILVIIGCVMVFLGGISLFKFV